MSETIIMIHGMWSGGWVWDKYKGFFENKGFICVTPTLKHHDMDPKDEPNPEIGKLSILDFAADLEKLINKFDAPPILIGHSMGGLLAQILAGRGLAEALILLSPASPHGIMALTPSVIKSFWGIMTKWGFWKKPIRQTFKEAAYSSLGRMTPEMQKEVFHKFVYESGRAASEIGFWYLDPKQATKVDESMVTCPVYVAGGKEDKITPSSVTRKVADKYAATYKEYDSHAHWSIEEPGWEKIAADTSIWLDKILSVKKYGIKSYVEQRSDNRIQYRAPVVFSEPAFEALYHGKMVNYSQNGIKFTSNTPLELQSDINIKFLDCAPGVSGPQANDRYKAVVMWTSKKTGKHPYNIGAQLFETRSN